MRDMYKENGSFKIKARDIPREIDFSTVEFRNKVYTTSSTNPESDDASLATNDRGDE